MIENRNLTTGTHLTARYHKQTFTCEVTEREGKPSYKLEDGREFKSPSAAGTAITGGACNGWAFWSLETAHDAKPNDTGLEVTELPSEDRCATQETNAIGEHRSQTGGSPKERHLPNEESEGRTRRTKYAGFATMRRAFMAPKAEKHATCPKDHKK